MAFNAYNQTSGLKTFAVAAGVLAAVVAVVAILAHKGRGKSSIPIAEADPWEESLGI